MKESAPYPDNANEHHPNHNDDAVQPGSDNELCEIKKAGHAPEDSGKTAGLSDGGAPPRQRSSDLQPQYVLLFFIIDNKAPTLDGKILAKASRMK